MEERKKLRRSRDKTLEEHIRFDEEFQDKINHVIFGLDPNEKGMKDKVDEMHDILIQARNVGGFFTGIKGVMGWLIVLGALVALFKGWVTALIAYLVSK